MSKCMCRHNSNELESESPVKLSSGEVNLIVTSSVTSSVSSSVTSSVNTSGWMCGSQCDKQCDEHGTDRAALHSKKSVKQTLGKPMKKRKKTQTQKNGVCHTDQRVAFHNDIHILNPDIHIVNLCV